MTNLEYVRQLPKEEFAKFLIYECAVEDYDYDWDENPYYVGMETYWKHPFCENLFFDENDALTDCIYYLNKEFEGVNNDKQEFI